MPHKLRIDGIRAELSSIESLIHEAVVFCDPIGKMQYEYRKSLLESELLEYQNKTETKASIALFFGGKPVFGSRGINADFAGKALNDFQRIISKVFASAELGRLGSRGSVSFLDDSQLMVTAVASGSFGFVLDEISEQMNLTETALKNVVDRVAVMIDKTADNDQEKFEEVLSEIDNRTLSSLRDFFINLDKNKATIRLVESDKEFNLDEISIKRARKRIENTSIDESNVLIEGVLQGFLPEHKKFELKLLNSEIIYGVATKEAAKTYLEMIANGNSIINEKCKIEASIRIVKPVNSPKRTHYTLLKFIF